MRRPDRSRLGTLLLVLGLSRPLGARTVRPAVVEFPGQARGKFELVNETLFPMTVVLEPRGFRVEPSGDLIEEPLDTSRMPSLRAADAAKPTEIPSVSSVVS